MDTAEADPQRSFLAGLRGEAFDEPLDATWLAEAPAVWSDGRNEETVLKLRRLPGLTEPRAAFETGRVLRVIARLFDQAGAPPIVGQQFVDNLAAAVIAHRSRQLPAPWQAEDTIAMFMEMYGRIFGLGDADYARVQDALMRWAKQDLLPLPGLGKRARSTEQGANQPASAQLAAA